MTKRVGSGSFMQTLLSLDMGEESSSDSDFRIEDHDNDDDDDGSDFTENDDDSDGGADDDDDDEDGDNDDDDGDAASGSDSDAPARAGGRKQPNGAHQSPAPDAKPLCNGTAATTATSSAAAAANAKQLQQAAKAREALERAQAKLLATPICCACLGDRSDDSNEIVECDNCGISVHEGCYGISDSASVSSTVSSCSTEPWFCEACKANVAEPVCELCPNRGGIFKETDVGKWVHLVCALYVPGVAFGEVDQLSAVTLFEMPYNKWGAKSCGLCDDVRFARTGVCIGCDAGMCKTYFHVTCAQAAGLLSEAHSEEADHADPFYAHCKVHSDKALIKKRKRNYNGLRLKMEVRAAEMQRRRDEKREQPASEEQQRIERKLKKHRAKYVVVKGQKQEPWVPTQKMPRLLSTSAPVCRQLMHKADLMGVDTAAFEFQEAQMAALADVRKKWHIPPAFSVEFIGYYLDRIARLKDIKASLQQQTQRNTALVDDQQRLRAEYDDLIRGQSAQDERTAELKAQIGRLHAAIGVLVPQKALPDVAEIGRPAAAPLTQPKLESMTSGSGLGHRVDATAAAAAANTGAQPQLAARPTGPSQQALAPPAAPPPLPARPMSVPTAAALKMGVGFPLTNLPGSSGHEDPNRILSTQCTKVATSSGGGSASPPIATPLPGPAAKLLHECGICAKRTDQHMLAKCDTCQLHYHLGCLNPPLQRHPKKSKLYGWQCSECVKSDDSDGHPLNLPTGKRKSRTKYAKDGTIVPVDPPQPQPPVVVMVVGGSDLDSTEGGAVSAEEPQQLTPMKQPTRAKGPGRPRKIATAAVATAVAVSATATVTGTEASADEGLATLGGSAKRRKLKKAAVGTSGGEQKARGQQSSAAAGAGNTEDEVDSHRSAVIADESAPSLTNGEPKASSSAKPKSAKKLKKAQLLIDAASAAVAAVSAASASPTTQAKPAFYIGQNGELISLSSSVALNLASPSVQQQPAVVAAESPDSSVPASSSTATISHPATAVVTAEAPADAVDQMPPTIVQSAETIHNSVAMTAEELQLLHKQNRKRRKELKHRMRNNAENGGGGHQQPNGGGSGGANGEGTESNREHKKKRKKRNHDLEQQASTSMCANDGIPRIKIKFKAISLPGEPAAESHCFYVSAAMVRPANDDEFPANESPVPAECRTTTPAVASPTPQQPQQQPHQQPDADVTETLVSAAAAVIADVERINSPISSPRTTANTPTDKALAAAIVAPKGAESATTSPIPRPVGRPPKPMPHRRLSVFNPRKFSAAVSKALKKTAGPKSAKAAAAAAAIAAAVKAAAAGGSVTVPSIKTPLGAAAGSPAEVTTTTDSAAVADGAASASSSATPSTASGRVAAAAAAAGVGVTSSSSSSGNGSQQHQSSPLAAGPNKCDVCFGPGTAQDVVRCDECKKCYHFRCLDPPLKKTPKRRGYSWHCADCDPTDTEST